MTFRTAVIDLSLVHLPDGPPDVVDEKCHEWLQILLPLVDQLQLQVAVQLPQMSQTLSRSRAPELLQRLHQALDARRAAAADQPLFQPIEMRAADAPAEPGDLNIMLLTQKTDLHTPASAGGSSRTWWCQLSERSADRSAPSNSDADTPEIAIFVNLSTSRALMQIAVSSAHWKEAGLHVIPLIDENAEQATVTAVIDHAQQLLMEFDYRTISAGVQLHSPVQPFSAEMFSLFQQSSGPLFLLAATSFLSNLPEEAATPMWQLLERRFAPLLLLSESAS